MQDLQVKDGARVEVYRAIPSQEDAVQAQQQFAKALLQDQAAAVLLHRRNDLANTPQAKITPRVRAASDTIRHPQLNRTRLLGKG